MPTSKNHTDINWLNHNNPVGWIRLLSSFYREGRWGTKCLCDLCKVSPLGTLVVRSHCTPAHRVRIYGQDTQQWCTRQSGILSQFLSGEEPYFPLCPQGSQHQFTEWMNEWMNSDARFSSTSHGQITVPPVGSFLSFPCSQHAHILGASSHSSRGPLHLFSLYLKIASLRHLRHMINCTYLKRTPWWVLTSPSPDQENEMPSRPEVSWTPL